MNADHLLLPHTDPEYRPTISSTDAHLFHLPHTGDFPLAEETQSLRAENPLHGLFVTDADQEDPDIHKPREMPRPEYWQKELEEYAVDDRDCSCSLSKNDNQVARPEADDSPKSQEQ